MVVGTPNKIIEYLKDKEGNYSCKEYKETRSQRQNRLYWQWLGDLVKCFKEKGIFITTDDLHEGLKEKLIPTYQYKNSFTGDLKIKHKSTTKLNKKEFSKYIEDIENYLWQMFEVTHPLPTDIAYDSFLSRK